MWGWQGVVPWWAHWFNASVASPLVPGTCWQACWTKIPQPCPFTGESLPLRPVQRTNGQGQRCTVGRHYGSILEWAKYVNDVIPAAPSSQPRPVPRGGRGRGKQVIIVAGPCLQVLLSPVSQLAPSPPPPCEATLLLDMCPHQRVSDHAEVASIGNQLLAMRFCLRQHGDGSKVRPISADTSRSKQS